jgi:hypothetical protein
VLSLAGPLAVASIVLAVAGAAKVRNPASALPAFEALRWPARSWAVRCLGAFELVLAAAAFLFGGRLLAAAVAATYAGFTFVALRLARSSSGASCGCFGSRSSQPTAVHVAADSIVTVTLVAAAIVDAPGYLPARSDLVAAGVPYLAFVALAAWLLIATLTVLAGTLSAARRTPARATVPSFQVTGVGR